MSCAACEKNINETDEDVIWFGIRPIQYKDFLSFHQQCFEELGCTIEDIKKYPSYNLSAKDLPDEYFIIFQNGELFSYFDECNSYRIDMKYFDELFSDYWKQRLYEIPQIRSDKQNQFFPRSHP